MKKSKNIFLGVLILVIFLVLFVLASQSKIFQTKGFNLASVISSVLVDLTNADRLNENLQPLTENPLLVEAAQAKANDMAQKGYFSHNSPEGLTPWYWMREVGYPFVYAGENLAINFTESEDVERGWMNSLGHKENILSENFTEIGIATAQGIYEGRETTFVVQMFGRPRSKSLTNEKPLPEEREADEVEPEEPFISEDDLEVLGETFVAVSEEEAVYVGDKSDYVDEDLNIDIENLPKKNNFSEGIWSRVENIFSLFKTLF